MDGVNLDLPGGATYRIDPSVGASVSLPAFATTDVQISNIQSKIGEKDFGAGVDVTVSIANGGNGGQKLGQDIQQLGKDSYNPAVYLAGKAVEAGSPAGTIDGSATLRIRGNGVVSYVGGETRPFPSYAVYAYVKGDDGKDRVVFSRERRETPPVENLTKPKIPW